jgi:DNA mismatch repair ATPase MutS
MKSKGKTIILSSHNMESVEAICDRVALIHESKKIIDGKKYFVLIDELFKGTNIQDAMKCSSAVIEGLQDLRNSLFIISTHLYEISDGLKGFENIQFSYFETAVKEKELIFHYQLKEGVSQDRLGYLILEREGVVDLLKNISKNKY